MRNRRHLLAVIAFVLLATATTALAAPSPTGNPQGIALARAVKQATDKAASYTYTQTGYVSLNDQEGRTSFFSWSWASGVVRKGWTKATEHATVVARHGRIIWWRDALTPPRCRGAGICHRIPVVVVVDHAGSFFAFGTPGHHTCYGTLSGTYSHVGDLVYTVVGKFAAPVAHGNSLLLSYSYPWSTSQTANETDTISSRTDLTQSGRTQVSSGGAGKPAFTIVFSDAYPAKTPGAPKINRCKR